MHVSETINGFIKTFQRRTLNSIVIRQKSVYRPIEFKSRASSVKLISWFLQGDIKFRFLGVWDLISTI